MERIAAVASNVFLVNRNTRQEIVKDRKAVSTVADIMKDCLLMSVVVMIGAALTLLLG